MKKWMLMIGVLGSTCVLAQQKSKPGKTATQNRAVTRQRQAPPAANGTVTLQNNGTYAAKPAPDTTTLRIADPVIRAFNLRSQGANIRLSGTGVLGMPRGSYGFANGQILFRATDATSIGGITGNGSVGTGSTPGSPGTGGLVPGVNGKNGFAGPSIWGSARGMNLPDSVLRKHPARLPR